jgi:hypothetical protein
MDYIFSTATQALLNSGQLVQVISKAGQLLPIARDPLTGRFVEIAIGVGSSFNPLSIPAQVAMGGLQMYQTHKGFTEVLGDNTNSADFRSLASHNSINRCGNNCKRSNFGSKLTSNPQTTRRRSPNAS